VRRALVAFPLCVLTGACAKPFLANDGTLVFQEPGAHGASVMTANGFEFHDVTDVPAAVVSHDPYEPWRAPVGFIVPASGRFTKTSQPTILTTEGLSISLRPSDTRVPSWGGEILVRVDVLAPAAKDAARWGEDVALVLDGRGPDTAVLCDAALAQLGQRDRVVVVDTAGAQIVVPIMPASHRSLILAAIERRVTQAPHAPRDRAGAVRLALKTTTPATYRRVLVVSDAGEGAREDVQEGMGSDLLPVAVLGSSTASGGDLDVRVEAIQQFVPAAGKPAFHDVVLAFEGIPAPSHILEATGGDARWQLEGGELALGDVRAGDARTEVLRVTIPQWTPGEMYRLHVGVRYGDLAHEGAPRTMEAELPCVYDNDIERLAESRHGDVIAYASALATLARLDAAFTGGVHGLEDLRPVARLHVRSLALLAKDMKDPAAADQAALLGALLDATDERGMAAQR
jgi:hypothetical protein